MVVGWFKLLPRPLALGAVRARGSRGPLPVAQQSWGEAVPDSPSLCAHTHPPHTPAHTFARLLQVSLTVVTSWPASVPGQRETDFHVHFSFLPHAGSLREAGVSGARSWRPAWKFSPGPSGGTDSRACVPIAAPSASLPHPDDLPLAPTYIGRERGTKNTPNRPRETLALPWGWLAGRAAPGPSLAGDEAAQKQQDTPRLPTQGVQELPRV